jgi:hypothetical protein
MTHKHGVAAAWCRECFCGVRWKRGILSFDGVKEMASEEWFRQLPLFAIVSILSGMLGALFNALHKALLPVTFPPFLGLLPSTYGGS